MIYTYSKFYYGHKITQQTNIIPLREGSTEIDVELRIGTYSLTKYKEEIQRALRQFGTQEYVVTLDRDTRFLTISAPLDFDLLFQTGQLSGLSNPELLGFAVIDFTGENSYTSSFGSGKSYSPQFLLQNFRDFKDNLEGIQSTVNETASGIVETISFGNKRLMECEIKFITDNLVGSGLTEGYIKNNPTGIEDANEFLREIIFKGDLEFIPDIDNPNEFTTCILEKTPESGQGTSYVLKEMLDIKLNDFYQTGKLTFREVIR